MSVLFEVVLPVQFPLAFVCIGVTLAIEPHKFLKFFLLRKGGVVLTEWNRVNVRAAGSNGSEQIQLSSDI